MGWRTVLMELGYALGAVALALIVIAPVFVVMNLIYADGDGIMPLLVTVVVAWLALAWWLRGRRVRL